MATREEVIAAYVSNPQATINPTEEAINYWMNAGLGGFNETVNAVRASNPELAAQIDVERTQYNKVGFSDPSQVGFRYVDIPDPTAGDNAGIATGAEYYNKLTDAAIPDYLGNNQFLVVDRATQQPKVQQGWNDSFFGGLAGRLGDIVSNPGVQYIGTAALLGNLAAGALGGTAAGAGVGVAADISFAAADAAQLAAQGLSEAQIAQTLATTGLDSFVAADMAQLASQGLNASQIASTVGSTAAGTGPGLFSNLGPAQTVAQGVSATGATQAATTGTTTGATQATTAGAASNALSGLTPTQIANLVKAGVSMAGLLGGGAALANTGTGGTGTGATTSGSINYSPEYYAQLQQYYNKYLPGQPADVVSPLAQWYESKINPTT